jgi:hypothetical protein
LHRSVALGRDGQKPDPPQLLALLRARRKRPSRRAPDKREEIASPHERPSKQATAYHIIK